MILIRIIMANTNYIDDDMRELMDMMVKAVVPRNRRRSVYRTNWHTPCYSHSRYRKVV